MGWSFYYPITYDHTQCGTADSANFPALIYFNAPAMRDVAHGGDVQKSDGSDILFFSDAPGFTSQLASEPDYYDNVNGIGWFWVKINPLSHSTNGTIYMAVGNASPPARTANPWDANYSGVWHFPNGSFLSGLDSTGNHNDATLVAGASAASGKVDGGIGFSGANTSYATVADAPTLRLTDSFTIEAWIKLGNTTQTQKYLLSKNNLYAVIVNFVANTFEFYGSFSGSDPRPGSQLSIADTNWHHIAYAYDGSVWAGYLDGAQIFSVNRTFSMSSGNDNITVGGSGPFSNHIIATEDEMRISKGVARSPSTILASVNNQFSPGNIGAAGFWTWGSKTALSGGSPSLLSMGVGF